MRRPLALLALFAVTCGLGACGTSGRDLRAPEPGAASPTRPTSSTAAQGLFGSVPNTLALVSAAFANGGPIPAEYACAGPSPSLTWSGVPKGTVELAIVVVDHDANDYVHWIVTDIAPTNNSIDTGELPPGATPHTNSAGRTSWFGPCPPQGTMHTYDFTMFALDASSDVADLPATEAVAALEAQVKEHGGTTAHLTGTYGTASSATGGTGTDGTGTAGTASVTSAGGTP